MTCKYAALKALDSVEEVRKQLKIGSIVEKGLNLDALKIKQAKLRDKMEMEE